MPVSVQPSQAEKNRMASMAAEPPVQKNDKGPMRLYVGSLHFNITEEMLRGIFEPFGRIQSIQLMTDMETGRSKGYGFITYAEADDAKKALEQMNGFELAGRAMKVGHVTERGEGSGYQGGGGFGGGLDTEEMDKAGIDLGATGRLALMAKLAQGTGLKLPQAANQALSSAAMLTTNMMATNSVADTNAAALASVHRQNQQQQHAAAAAAGVPPIATQCFMLSNMFDPATETAAGWDVEVRDDVIEEGSKHGGFVHIVVDKVSPQGNVYVKCPTVPVAVAAVNALHGRWFAGEFFFCQNPIVCIYLGSSARFLSVQFFNWWSVFLFQARSSQQHMFPWSTITTCSRIPSTAPRC